MKVEKITRALLKKLKPMQSLTVDCRDGYDVSSQKNTAYDMGRILCCKFSCHVEGLTVTVTRI